jgi:enamine deaminase RidA (YjgF/YER057c/UK114 family)
MGDPHWKLKGTAQTMSGRIDARLRELDLTLPNAVAPVANYVPFVISGNLVFVSGQVTIGPKGLEYVGIVGKDFDVDQAKAAARLCALNIIGQLKAAAMGDLDRIKRIVKVTGFVNAVPGFTQHPEVINGASDLFVAVFDDAGRHARAAVGAGSLPRNVAVEIEAIAELS